MKQKSIKNAPAEGANSITTAQTEQPIDHEALPFPSKKAPELITTLVKQLPPCWQQTAALALLPALSTAAGGVSYAQGKPLAFQVAIYGMAGSGKSLYTCRPAQLVQEIVARRDNDFRVKGNDCPRVLGFETSIIQLAKYLQRNNARRTVMLYTDEISQSVGTKSSFLQLQPIIRKGFDAILHTMDYKEENSFRGSITPRLSFLACGTPDKVFQYFDAKAIEEGTSRRVVFVEHHVCKKEIDPVSYTTQEKDYITQQIDWLEQQNGELHNEEIEQAVKKWKASKQKFYDEDEVKRLMVNTPADVFKRAAYLAYTLNHYSKTKESITFGKWVAEYMIRAAMHHTFSELKNIQEKGKNHFCITSEQANRSINSNMLKDLSQTFTYQEMVAYRQEHNYPGDAKNSAILTRWQEKGYIKKTKKGTYQKLI